MSTLGAGTAWVAVAPDGAAFAAKTKAIVDSAVKGLNPNVSLGLNMKPDVAAKLAGLTTSTAALQRNLANLKIGVSDAGSLAKLTALQARAVALQKTLGNKTTLGATNTDDLLSAESRYLGIAAAIEQVSTASSEATKSYGLWGTAMAALQHHTELFGGAFNDTLPEILSSVSGWHMLTEAVIETTAVWVPAAIAVGVFGAAAYSTAKNVVEQFEHMNTASTALGTSLPGLSGGFSRMEEAAKPQVYQLLGDALLIAGHNTGTLGAIASSTGSDLDKLGARIVAALTSTSGAGKMAQTASQDMNLLFTAFGNLFGVLGNLMQVVPGYATDLLKIGTAGLAVAEDITRIAEPVLKVALAFHGAWIYVGLFGTLLTKVITGGLGSLAGMVLKGAVALDGLGAAGGVAATGLTEVGGAIETVSSLNWGVITTIALGFVYLADKMATATDATQKWIQAEQSAVTSAPIAQVLNQNAAALAATTEKLQSATKAAKGFSVAASNVANINPVTGGLSALGEQSTKAVATVTELTEAQKGFNAQNTLVQGRLASLAKQFGGTSNAMALMNAAGITSQDITDKSNSDWQQSVIMMEAQQAGYNEMALGAGRYGAAMLALSDPLTTFDAKMSQITQAQSTLMTTITGGETAFTSYAQGIATLASDSDHGRVSLNNLGSAALNMSSDFYSQINAAQSLISSLESQGVSTKNLTKAVATQAAQMLAFAGNNEAARATIISLINDAVGPGTVSFSNLNAWVGKNKTSMSGLQQIVGQTTVAAAGMAGTIGQLTATLFAQDLMLASNVTPAVKNYAEAIANSGQASDATKSARAALINDLEKAGISAQTAGTYVNNLTASLHKVPSKVSTSITDTVTGNGTIKASQSITGQSSQMIGSLKFVASGGHITGPGGPTSDSIPAMLSAGEYVVNASAVSKYGKSMMDAINGQHFATGGLAGVTSGVSNIVPDSNSWSATFSANVGTAFAKALQTSQAASGGSPVNYSPTAGVNQWKSVVLQALALNGLPASLLNQVLYQMQTESGGNPNAQNNWDSNAAAGDPSRGLLQTIGTTFAAYHVAGTSENIFNPLANVAAAINYAKHEYGPTLMSDGMGLGSGHGYSAGGILPEKIIGLGMQSGSPYSFGSGEWAGPASLAGQNTTSGMPLMNQYQGNQLINLLGQLLKVSQQQPQNYARALNSTVGSGIRRAGM
jgi:SLT domain-containing protein